MHRKFKLILLLGFFWGPGVSGAEKPLFDPDAYTFTHMELKSVRPSTLASLNSTTFDFERLNTHPEFVITSNEIGYINEVFAALSVLKSAPSCTMGKQLVWILTLSDDKQKAQFFSDGRVISGPGDFCKMAEGIRSFDVVGAILAGRDAQNSLSKKRDSKRGGGN